MLTLSVNGAIEINVFLSSINTSVKARVNADARREYTLKVRVESKIQRQLNWKAVPEHRWHYLKLPCIGVMVVVLSAKKTQPAMLNLTIFSIPQCSESMFNYDVCFFPFYSYDAVIEKALALYDIRDDFCIVLLTSKQKHLFKICQTCIKSKIKESKQKSFH